jgi:hypothetical protein
MKTPKKLWLDYKTATPARWRKIGDFALLTIPVIDGILLSIPTKWMDMEMTKFLSSIWSLLALGIKFWTNTHKENENMDNNSN